MSLNLRRYFSNLFVSVILEDGQCHLMGRVLKNGHVIKTFENVFDNKDSDKLDSKVISFLENKEKEYNAMYTAFYLDSLGQGAIAGSDISDFAKHSVDVKNVTYINVEKKNWALYASFIDIKFARTLFSSIPLDLLYSPFILLFHLIKRDGGRKKPTLYMYNHKDSFALGVFKEDSLLFGAFFRTAMNQEVSNDEMLNQEFEDNWDNVEEENGVENLIELDDIENDSDDEFGDLDDIESLDEMDEHISLEDDDSPMFEDNSFEEPLEEDDGMEHFSGDAASSMELFGRDMMAFKYIKSSIEEFYQNTNYESDFIEDIVIYDNHSMSKTVLQILESELMMKVEIKDVKTLELMLDVATLDMKL